MSVYTSVTAAQLDAFFGAYDLGQVVDSAGIPDGIANSHYAVATTQGDYVLTLFEAQNDEELTPVIELLQRLGAHNPLYPNPQADRQNRLLRNLNGKPALVCKRLAGRSLVSPTLDQCRQIGAQLARLHVDTRDYAFPIASHHDVLSIKALFEQVESQLSGVDLELILAELQFQAEHEQQTLPGGVIHGDLFRDNALFADGQISGILDFYSACRDHWLRDIAVCANDWCCDDGIFNTQKLASLLSGYETLRPLSATEHQHCNRMLRAAALRFWLSRLVHHHSNRAAALSQPKDPFVFKDLLVQHRNAAHA